MHLTAGDGNFIKQLVNYDKDNMTDRILKKIGTYCSQSDFQPEIIGRVSLAAKSLCMWVRAMEVYGRIYRVVEPKKQRLHQATSQLQEKQAILADAKAKLKEVGMRGRREKLGGGERALGARGNKGRRQGQTQGGGHEKPPG